MALGNLGQLLLRFQEPILKLYHRYLPGSCHLGLTTEFSSRAHLSKQMSTRSTTTTATRPVRADISISSTTRRISSSYQNQPISTA